MAKRQNRSKEIREVFIIHGSQGSINSITQHCIRAGVWAEEDQHNILVRSLRREVADALKQHDDDGLPFAIITAQRDAGAPIWVQLALTGLDDCLYKLAHDIQGMTNDNAANLRFHDYIEERFETKIIMPTYDPGEAEEWMKRYLDLSDDDTDSHEDSDPPFDEV